MPGKAEAGSAMDLVNQTIVGAAPAQIAAAERSQAERQSQEDARYNLATLTEAIGARDQRKTAVFLNRVFATGSFAADAPVIAAIKSGQTELAQTILSHPVARLEHPGLVLAQAAIKGDGAVMRVVASDEDVVLKAMDEVLQLTRQQTVDEQRTQVAVLADLGGARAHDKLRALDQRIAEDRRNAEAERVRNLQQARERERQEAQARERDRQAYLTPKRVGDKVCKPGSVAFGLLAINISAYVERVEGNRLQLRINSTDGQSVNYDGGPLYQGKVIWDSFSEWKSCP
jgi:hypothetical protein